MTVTSLPDVAPPPAKSCQTKATTVLPPPQQPTSTTPVSASSAAPAAPTTSAASDPMSVGAADLAPCSIGPHQGAAAPCAADLAPCAIGPHQGAAASSCAAGAAPCAAGPPQGAAALCAADPPATMRPLVWMDTPAAEAAAAAAAAAAEVALCHTAAGPDHGPPALDATVGTDSVQVTDSGVQPGGTTYADCGVQTSTHVVQVKAPPALPPPKVAADLKPIEPPPPEKAPHTQFGVGLKASTGGLTEAGGRPRCISKL